MVLGQHHALGLPGSVLQSYQRALQEIGARISKAGHKGPAQASVPAADTGRRYLSMACATRELLSGACRLHTAVCRAGAHTCLTIVQWSF